MFERRDKSAEELKYTIGKGKRIGILSCGACANLCDVGGVRGMNFIKAQVEEWGNTVVAARTIVACCPVPIMGAAQKTLLQRSKIDVLVIISCAAGVKSAFMCNPGIPIVAACDTVGAACLVNTDNPIDDFVANSLCTSCGHCVIPYTFGICPLATCPSKSLYGPCSKAPEEGEKCGVDSSIDCVWKEVERRGADLAALNELKKMHKEGDQNRIPSLNGKSSGGFLRKSVGLIGSKIPGRLMEVVHWAR